MTHDDDDFASLFEASQHQQPGRRGARKLRTGEQVEGVVVQVGREYVFVDVGAKAEARIAREQLADAQGALSVQVGDRIRATVKHPGGREGGPELVKSLRGGGVGLAAIELAQESGAPIAGTVSKIVKGGVEVTIGGVRAFCPASQVDVGYSPSFDHMIDQSYQFKVVEVRDGGRSVIVSRKAVVLDERNEQARELRAKLEVGAEIEGTVRSIQPYGAFIDLGGLEGLAHISELGHGRVDRVEDVVQLGERVTVRVLAIEARDGDPENLKISLSMKTGQPPAASASAEGDSVHDGTVASVNQHGVFVDTELGRGLVPARELGIPQGADPRRAFPVGKEVRVTLISRDSSGRLRFSVRGVQEAEERSNFRSFAKEGKQKSKSGFGNLGDLLRDKIGDAPVPAGPAKPARAATSARAPSKPREPAPAAADSRPNRRRRVK
ncbi:MAG: S1 RNA-binding domain-containing protein [Myxococcales bacterium]|nr:S1 RNA-binding domain-containing protein [Myxococcales bacterium]MCB9754329.1 S1 RNA-binding domain-containing protein [Myxococcales bacterium]